MAKLCAVPQNALNLCCDAKCATLGVILRSRKNIVKKIAVRKMVAQRYSIFAVSPSGKPPRTGFADIRSRLTREDFVVASKY